MPKTQYSNNYRKCVTTQEKQKIKDQRKNLTGNGSGIAVIPDQHDMENLEEIEYLINNLDVFHKITTEMKAEWDSFCKKHEKVTDILSLKPELEEFQKKWKKDVLLLP